MITHEQRAKDVLEIIHTTTVPAVLAIQAAIAAAERRAREETRRELLRDVIERERMIDGK